MSLATRREAVEIGRVGDEDLFEGSFTPRPFGQQIKQPSVVWLLLPFGGRGPATAPNRALRRRLDVGRCDRPRVGIVGRTGLTRNVGTGKFYPRLAAIEQAAEHPVARRFYGA